MQCYICLEEIKNPWDEEGIFSTCVHPCCGRPVHNNCFDEAREHRTRTCPWCRAVIPTKIHELKLLLSAGVRANRGWAMMQMAAVYRDDPNPKLGSDRLTISLLERAIKRLSEGDEWSCKLASCAKISLATSLLRSAEISPDVIHHALGLLHQARREGHPGADKCIETVMEEITEMIEQVPL